MSTIGNWYSNCSVNRVRQLLPVLCHTPSAESLLHSLLLGVLRKYRLVLLSCTNVHALFDKALIPNQITIPGKLFVDGVHQNFHSGQDEVTMTVDMSELNLRNYVDDAPRKYGWFGLDLWKYRGGPRRVFCPCSSDTHNTYSRIFRARESIEDTATSRSSRIRAVSHPK